MKKTAHGKHLNYAFSCAIFSEKIKKNQVKKTKNYAKCAIKEIITCIIIYCLYNNKNNYLVQKVIFIDKMKKSSKKNEKLR